VNRTVFSSPGAMGFTAAEAAAMDAALAAAALGVRGANPLVGASVLGADGDCVTGYHRGAGTPHAEIDALARARAAGIDLGTATLLVTLEPCNHTGRTGPCARAIIAAGIPRVIFAQADPVPGHGGGAETLLDAGVEVRSGLRGAAAGALNARWFAAARGARPFVTAKIAQSLDGFSAAADGTSQWITSAQAREHAHGVRGRVDAILVGTGTVLADDPRLSARLPTGEPAERQPVPVVIGSRDVPADAQLRANPGLRQYRPAGSGLRSEAAGGAGEGAAEPEFLLRVLRDLKADGCDHVLVEGGPGLVGSFLQAGLVDELLVYTAPLLLGAGTPSVRLPGIGTLRDALAFTPDPASAPASAPVRLGPDMLTRLVPGEADGPGSAGPGPSSGQPPADSAPQTSTDNSQGDA
jgi:diaminohydroxyphosphoribosylaminopyrimidine deaminase/5-amino-6-(5-phosphoribosylamino)uracil reductase